MAHVKIRNNQISKSTLFSNTRIMRNCDFKIRGFILFVAFLCNLQLPLIAQESTEDNNFKAYYSALESYQSGDSIMALNKISELFQNTEFGDLSHIYNTLSKAIESKRTDLIQIMAKSGARKGASINDLKNFVTNVNFGGNSDYGNLIKEENYKNDINYYQRGLDSFLISELLNLENRDQLFRHEYPHKFPEGYDQYIDSLNFLVLTKLIEQEGGKLPPYRKIGSKGSSALNTILIHLNIDMIAEIFPAIVKSIKQEEFFDAETILYQIDRNIVGGYPIYKFDKQTGTLIECGHSTLLHNKLGNHQYYGSMDLSDMKTRTVYFWPFEPNIDKNTQQEMYDILRIAPSLTNPMKSHIKLITKQEFINLFLDQD